MAFQEPDKILTTREVSKILNVHPDTVRKALRRESDPLPSFKIGGENRVRESKLWGWIEQQELKSSPKEGILTLLTESKKKPKGGLDVKRLKVRKSGKNRWSVEGFGGIYSKKDSRGFTRWYGWIRDESDGEYQRPNFSLPLVTNLEEAKIAYAHKANQLRREAFMRMYCPDDVCPFCGRASSNGNGNGSVKLSTLLDEWLENYAIVNLANKGKAGEAVVRYWKDSDLVNKKVSDITSGDILFHFSEELKEVTKENEHLEKAELDEALRRAKQTQRNRGSMLRSIFNWAKKMGRYGVSANPVEGTLPKKESKDTEGYTAKQVQLFFDVAKTLEMPWMLPVIFHASVAGNRRGELENLRVEHINLEEGWYKIVHPKEGKSKRIDLDKSSALYAMLKRLIESQEGLNADDFRNGDCGYVYIYQNPRFGDKWTRIPMDEHFLVIRREAEKIDPTIKGKTFHSFRHTAGSLALSAGSNAKAVQAIYGHSTEKMTRHYLHASREEKAQVIRNAENQLIDSKSVLDAVVAQG
jgi:excisionase family DNA binding protein